MDSKEFIIKKFEMHYPNIVKIIGEWEEFSIKKNWDEVKIILNEKNVPDAPASEWDTTINKNKRWNFFNILSEKTSEYLRAKGCVYTIQRYPVTLECPENKEYKYLGGHCIIAGYDKKYLETLHNKTK